MCQCTKSLVLLATTLPLLLINFFVSCDVLPDANPSPSYGAYVKCPKRELSELIGEPTLGNHGFRIKISGNPERYVPGQMYTVVLQGEQRLLSSKPAASVQKFTEFLLQVEPKEPQSSVNGGQFSGQHLSNGNSPTAIDVGSFQPYGDNQVRLSELCSNAVTQTNSVPKSEISVMWLAPMVASGCVVFKAAVVEQKDLWYMDDDALSRTLCPEDAESVDEQPDVIEDCCACDEAKYEVTFEGLWSKYTHPKEFPQTIWQTHFSDIIGASHSADFRIWEYGGYATEGVRQVAEFGITKKLEAELKTESNKIRTIIKARGLWYPNLNGKTFAVFRVDNKHHLMSLLSMLGPSPDWIVGVSALELCLKNCSWVSEKVMNLYLWDAGTDSGVTYTSPNTPTIPQERIRRITSTMPSQPESPFYDSSGTPMKPIARLTVARQRIYEKACGADGGNGGGGDGIDSIDSDEDERYDCKTTEWTMFSHCSVACGEGVRIRTRNYINEKRAKEAGCSTKLIEKEECGGKCINNISCETSPWGEWQPCNVSCGRGFRQRSRKFIHRLARKVCTSVELVDREPCIGAGGRDCSSSSSGGYEQGGSAAATGETELIEPKCAVTNWAEWSPCTESCGKGVRIRTRLYINSYKSKNICNVQLIESEECLGEACGDRNDARSTCSLAREVGPCRGYFPRYYFDSNKGLCVQFIYSGCRGNSNNFERLADCKEKCENLSKGSYGVSKPSPFGNYTMLPPVNDGLTVIDCVVTPWSDWSPCSRSCGTARKERRREIKLNAQNGGRPCPKKLVQRRKCKENPPCDCEMSEWGEWLPCSAPCNGHGYEERRRNITQAPSAGRAPCGAQVERRYCFNLEPCNSSSTSSSKGDTTITY